MALIFVTTNKHKFDEASELASRHGIELKHNNTQYMEIQADTLEEIVKPSAMHACSLVKAPCFAEDAGLFVQALRGFPGPYSKFVFSTLGNKGLLKLMDGESDRKAEFASAVGYREPGQDPHIFVKKVKGVITTKERGTHGFGFDPIFEPAEGSGRTFAEMSTSEKNRFSHRAGAITRFFEWYKQRKEKTKR